MEYRIVSTFTMPLDQRVAVVNGRPEQELGCGLRVRLTLPDGSSRELTAWKESLVSTPGEPLTQEAFNLGALSAAEVPIGATLAFLGRAGLV